MSRTNSQVNARGGDNRQNENKLILKLEIYTHSTAYWSVILPQTNLLLHEPLHLPSDCDEIGLHYGRNHVSEAMPFPFKSRWWWQRHINNDNNDDERKIFEPFDYANEKFLLFFFSWVDAWLRWWDWNCLMLKWRQWQKHIVNRINPWMKYAHISRVQIRSQANKNKNPLFAAYSRASVCIFLSVFALWYYCESSEPQKVHDVFGMWQGYWC